LTVIIGSGELTLEKLAPGHPSRGELEALLDAAATAATLTKQLLAFSRQQPWRPVELDVSAVIRNMIGLVQRMTGVTVQIECEFGSDIPTVFVDRSQLEQVIMNLAINARDAMPKGGRLLIATSKANGALIRITDSGIGMTPAVLAH